MSDDRKTVRLFGLEGKVERLAETGTYPSESEVIRDAIRRLPEPANDADDVERGEA